MWLIEIIGDSSICGQGGILHIFAQKIIIIKKNCQWQKSREIQGSLSLY